MASTVTDEIRHSRLAVLNIKGSADAASPIGFSWLLVTGVPAGATCEGLTHAVGPLAYIEDKGKAGTFSSGDFQVGWDLLATGTWELRPFRPSCDPAVPGQDRDRLRRSRIVYYVPTHPESGFYRVRRARRLARRYQGQFVDHGMLAPELRGLLARTQDAADTLTTSRAAAASRIEAPAPHAALHEWEIACALRDLTNARPPPEGTAVEAQDDPSWAREVTGSATARLQALERYAAQVAAADAALDRQERAMKASDEEPLDDEPPAVAPTSPARPEDDSEVVDLLARTARDEHAITDLKHLADEAGMTAEAIRDTSPPAGSAKDLGGGA